MERVLRGRWVGLLRMGCQRAAALKIDHDILPLDPPPEVRNGSLAAIGKVEAIDRGVQRRDDGHLKATIPILLRAKAKETDPYLTLFNNNPPIVRENATIDKSHNRRSLRISRHISLYNTVYIVSMIME